MSRQARRQRQPGPFKRLSRRLRLAFYHWRHGPGFTYHGIPISIPDEIPFGMKRRVIRGRYEEPERRLVERFLDRAQPVIEVGGSLGVLSAYIGHRLLPHVPYVIVEANSRIVETCRANARAGRGPDGQVTVVNAALAYGASEVSFPVDDNIHGNRLGSDGPDMVTVPAHTLSDLRTMLGSPAGSFTLVMDIEGYEFDAFENDREALAACTLAIVETHPSLFSERGKTLEDFLDLVRSSGFEVLARDGESFAFGRT